MTIKHLTGAYPGGYTLSTGYSGLFIEATASIGGAGVVANFNATIENHGIVDGSETIGVNLKSGGGVTNGSASDRAALIEGANSGVGCFGGATAITNFGTIKGDGDRGAGVFATADINLINGSARDTTALITGGYDGVSVVASKVSITNFGVIETTPSPHGQRKSGIYAVAQSIDIVNLGAIIPNGGYYGVEIGLIGGYGQLINGSASDTSALIAGRIGVDVNSGSTGTETIVNFGTIIGSGGTAVRLARASNVLEVEAGSVFQGAVLGAGGTLDLASGAGTISGLAGGKVTVSGSMAATTFTNFGTLEIAGGATFTLRGSSTLGAGGTTKLIDDGALIVVGAIGGTGTLSVGGTLTLKVGASVNAAAATFGAGALINGAGTLTLADAAVAGLSVGGKTVIDDVGFFDQTGAIVLGKGASAPRLTIAEGAVYRLDGDVGVARRSSKPPAILVDGLFVKTAGTGVGSVGVAVSDVGTIEAETGTLSFLARVDGTGLMEIDAGATLRFANKVAGALTARFAGAGGTLALSKADLFAATIAGFAAGESIDLIGAAATSAVLGPDDQLVISDGATAVATLQLTGNYTGATFAAASDGHGGTAITVSGGSATVPAHGFIAAMAAMTPAAGAGHTPGWRPEEACRPPLASPRAALA